MAANLEMDEYVYPSNLDDSDFERTITSSPDVASEILIPHLFNHLVQILKLKLWRKMKITQMETSQIHMDYLKLQFTNYPGDHENEEDFQDGWYWAYLPNEQDTGPEYRPILGKQQLLWTHA